MTDEITVDRLASVIERRTGCDIMDYEKPLGALDALLSHAAAAGRIARHGQNWFSPEDRQRLTEKTHSGPLMTVMPTVINAFLNASYRCKDGEEFCHLVAEFLMSAHDQIADWQTKCLDLASRTPSQNFFPKGFSEAKESHASDMNSYGAGYDDGYENALVSVLSMMNGEED